MSSGLTVEPRPLQRATLDHIPKFRPNSLLPTVYGCTPQERELGRGQFGSVHLGRWLGIHVALKELFVGPQDETRAATAEACMLASHLHPTTNCPAHVGVTLTHCCTLTLP